MPNSYEIREYAYYCPKCGQCHFITYGSSELCLVCKTKMIQSPHEYDLTEEKVQENYELFELNQQRLFDEVISKSPEFDITLYNNKDSILKQQERQQEEAIAHGKTILEVKSNIPKCPTCNSANVEKISIGKKAFGGALFGLFSSDVRNSMHCKNCGAKW